ncbi:MAG: site-specific DNA-methyltransferase [Chloroflexi bacterium]|nr:site-specific DNA-methyltransferase [Chloroflexota bacterium]
MAEKTPKEEIKLEEAKGRPLLTWLGKRPLSGMVVRPAQPMHIFDPSGELKAEAPRQNWSDWSSHYPTSGLLFFGDNKEALAHLIAKGFRHKVKLIYIDPPFDSGADYVRKVQLRGVKNLLGIEGEGQSLVEQTQYRDIWNNDSYLQFMYDRLSLLKELLKDDGFIAVHLNSTRIHYVKCILDEVFDGSNFINEIVVKRIRKNFSGANGVVSLNEGCDYILLYSKGGEVRLKPPKIYSPKEERWHSFDAPSVRLNLSYELFGKMPPPNRHWMRTQEEAQKMIKAGELRPNPNTGWPEYSIEATELMDRDTLWEDITASAFTTGYPTEKKEELIKLFIEMTTNPGDLVLDCFVGSGTTVAVAQKLGRRWIGCDLNKGAIQTTSKRLQTIIQKQLEKSNGNGAKQNGFDGMEPPKQPPPPAQLSFAVYRINNYDLQIQHNEAVELVCQQIGVTRSKTDSFFDGTLGNKLVKIVPVDHPLTPLDLEAVKRELEARRGEEQRAIVMLCLGAQADAKEWLEHWNKFRGIVKLDEGNQPLEFVNKIEVVDLYGDGKYSGFLAHDPAKAEVKAERQGEKLKITITTFISPTIIKRLKLDANLFQARISDWRSMVNSVELDPAYNGNVFNVVFSDLPEKKNDLIVGVYELPAPAQSTTIAIRITDMLGEEVLKVIQNV